MHDAELVHLAHEVGDGVGRAHAAAAETAERQIALERLQRLGREVLVLVDLEIDRTAVGQIVLGVRRVPVQVDAHRQQVGERDVRMHVDHRTDGTVADDEAPVLRFEPGEAGEVEEVLEAHQWCSLAWPKSSAARDAARAAHAAGTKT